MRIFAPLPLIIGTAAMIPFGMEDALTGSNIPERFLSATSLTGSFPLTASRIDPRVSYAMYVPEEHYDPKPNSTQEKLPLLVDIHGTGRGISSILREDEHRAFARSTRCAILAPLFPAGLEGPNDLDSYKLLRTPTLRADLALLSILDEIAYRWPGVETAKIYMMGFSGGGQFAHRFLYLHPERLLGISIGAPGRVTCLDEAKQWPQGISDVQDLFGKGVRKSVMDQVPIQLVIGSLDTEIHGGQEFWKWVQENVSGGGLSPMNQSRLETLKELQINWERNGISSELDIVPGVAHNSSDPRIRQAVYGFLQPLIEANQSWRAWE